MKKDKRSPQRLAVKKETIRILQARALRPEDLAQVHGGIVIGFKYTYRCTTGGGL